MNPRDGNLLLSTGADHLMKCWDLRRESEPVFTVQHSRMIPAVCFSPLTGSKILSTCTDSK